MTNSNNDVTAIVESPVKMGSCIDYEALEWHRKFTNHIIEQEARLRLKHLLRKNNGQNGTTNSVSNGGNAVEDIEVDVTFGKCKENASEIHEEK